MRIPMQIPTSVKLTKGELTSLVVLTFWVSVAIEVLHQEADDPPLLTDMTKEGGRNRHALNRTVYPRLPGDTPHLIRRLGDLHQDKPRPE